MRSKPESIDEQIRRAKVEKMWLSFYNQTLLEKGLITHSEYKKMQAQISARKGPLTR